MVLEQGMLERGHGDGADPTAPSDWEQPAVLRTLTEPLSAPTRSTPSSEPGRGDAVVWLSLAHARERNVFLVNKAAQAGEPFQAPALMKPRRSRLKRGFRPAGVCTSE